MSEYDFEKIKVSLAQIAEAMERLSPPPIGYPDFEDADAFVWSVSPNQLKPVPKVSKIRLELLVGINKVRDILLENTLQFSKGLSANNALLWGSRGMGKSSLIKAIHQKIIDKGLSLKIVELQREDLSSVGTLLNILRNSSERFLLFCDDLSFSYDDQHYKSLKAILDGGLEGRPENVLFYATSNRRHLMPRDMIENEKSSSINPSEAVEEKVSLSDRFGLWLGFHPCSQDEYLEMITRYCDEYGVSQDLDLIKSQAIEWQATRGARSGRVAWQFFVDLAARNEVNIGL
ncbi:ATP-binding protein [Paracoccaceae bacterium]|nr:ATP-binding protein [Paracoccaceae bacterium]